ncbi:FadR/GntR family transcriptional regulator [Staphylospora marina]|uniref:FadR/GntR family transcriptional regulator n=1 Tax=Staphylospora marina TaxID=2490858 RepID=UPI000F5BCC50|nr:FadR/GntR family transcriptional regulator [Staphylospora marina]
MQFKQIHRKKIYEEVADQIRQLILDRKLKPGDRLASVIELAEHFRVGRSAVREALSALQAMGYIEMRQGEGTFVRHFDVDSITHPLSPVVLLKGEEIRQLLEVRRIMESSSAELAAYRRTPEDLQTMSEALERMKEGMDGAEEIGEKADLDFHMAVAEATHNRMLSHFMKTLSSAMRETMKESRKIWLYGERATAELLYKEHESIYQAIRDGDGAEARKRMCGHIAKVEEFLQELLNSQKDLK